VSPLRVVRAEGDGIARGTQIGVELRDLIQASVGFYHRYLDRRGVSSEQLQDLLTPYLVAAETAYPDMMSVLKGMAVGALVPVLELFAINAFEELEPLLESPEGELLFLQRKEGYRSKPRRRNAHSERLRAAARRPNPARPQRQWLAGDAGNIAVIVDRPAAGRVPVASPTVVCLPPPSASTVHGTATGVGSLTARRRRASACPGAGLAQRAREPAIATTRPPACGDARAGGRVQARVRVRRRGHLHPGDQRAGHRVLEGAGPHETTTRRLMASLAPPPPGVARPAGAARGAPGERPVTGPHDL
jgi:hypothetical protein